MPVSPWELLVRLLAALFLGAVVGFDRQRHEHPAGLRTHVLVALASATFMLVSTQLAFFQHFGANEQYRVDPSRIASGIVMGMGFLGAGSILRSGRGIRGLTTAASLWLVAALGMAASGKITADVVWASALCLPVTFAAAWIGARAYLGVSPATFRLVILGLLFMSGILLLAETLLR